MSLDNVNRRQFQVGFVNDNRDAYLIKDGKTAGEMTLDEDGSVLWLGVEKASRAMTGPFVGTVQNRRGHPLQPSKHTTLSPDAKRLAERLGHDTRGMRIEPVEDDDIYGEPIDTSELSIASSEEMRAGRQTARDLARQHRRKR